jgi:hypothetical protein
MLPIYLYCVLIKILINGVFSAIESAVNRNKSRGIERRLKWYAKYEIIKTP